MATEIPQTATDIDPAWLTRVLSDRYPGVRASAVEVIARTDATNSHARLRAGYEVAAGAPKLMFCKLLPADPDWRPVIAATGMGLREARFYSRLADRLAMRIPVVHAALCNESDGSFVLLLEDLESSGCSVPDGTTGVTPDAAAVALEDLADLHVRFEDPAGRAAEASWVPQPLNDPNYAGGMLRHGLDRHRERLSENFARIAELYIERPVALHALWQRGPTTVIHGDPHLGNLFDDDGRTGFLDWGIISLGTPMRDVGYFLCMALDIEVRRRYEQDLIRHYLAARAAAGLQPIRFDVAWRAHQIHAAYTVVACCQIVTFPESQSEARHRFSDAFLARAQAAVTDLESAAVLRRELDG